MVRFAPPPRLLLIRFQSRVSVVYITLTGNSKLLPLLSPPRRSDLACLATEERHSPNPVFDPPRGETHRHRGAETRRCSPRQGVSQSRFNVPPSQHKFQLKAQNPFSSFPPSSSLFFFLHGAVQPRHSPLRATGESFFCSPSLFYALFFLHKLEHCPGRPAAPLQGSDHRAGCRESGHLGAPRAVDGDGHHRTRPAWEGSRPGEALDPHCPVLVHRT